MRLIYRETEADSGTPSDSYNNNCYNYVPNDDSPPCNENYKKLTLQKLKEIYSSMSSPVTFSYIDPQQQVVHKCLGRLFQAGCSGHCKRRKKRPRKESDSEMQLIHACSDVTTFWSTWSPCIDCSKELVKHITASNQLTGLTIYVGKRYIDTRYVDSDTVTAVTDEQYKNRYRMCLAWLSEAGIQLIPWDWDVFSNAVGINKETSCYNVVQFIKGQLDKDQSINRRNYNTIFANDIVLAEAIRQGDGNLNGQDRIDKYRNGCTQLVMNHGLILFYASD